MKRETDRAKPTQAQAARPAQSKRQRPLRCYREKVEASARPAIASTVPEPLRAWIRAGEARVVQINSAGVLLHTLAGVQRFPSVQAAIAAVG